MTPTPRRERLDAHLDTMLDLPTAEQDSYVSRLAAEDGSLANELRDLLRAHRVQDGLLDQPVARVDIGMGDGTVTREPKAREPEARDGVECGSGWPHLATSAIADLPAGLTPRLLTRALRDYLWLWPSFILLDAYLAFVAYPDASFAFTLACRAVVELVLVITYQMTLRESIRPGRLLTMYGIVCTSAALGVSVMAIQFGGIQSPYLHGVTIIALACMLLTPMPWQRAWPIYLGIDLTIPGTVLATCWLWPDTGVAAADAALWRVFLGDYLLVIGGSLLGLYVSNLSWSMQQQMRLLGSYELETRIGRGGMGDVWRARHRLLARPAAIKVIRSGTLAQSRTRRATAIARFEREAKVTASLHSPHTIALYDFGVSERRSTT